MGNRHVAYITLTNVGLKLSLFNNFMGHDGVLNYFHINNKNIFTLLHDLFKKKKKGLIERKPHLLIYKIALF